MSESTERAAAQLAEFQQKKEPLCLQEASDVLERVSLGEEKDAMKRLVLRRETLTLWLALIAIIDQHTDPNFNPADVPSTSVQPPTVNGVTFPPGVSPDKISDPQARAQYEAEIKKNDQHAVDYRLQTRLKQLGQSVPPKAERFIRMSYTTVPGDQREVTETIHRMIRNPERAAALARAAAPKGK
jgi:hypothetical protein